MISSSFTRCYLPSGNKTYIVPTIRKRHKEQQIVYHPDGMVAGFLIEVCLIFLFNTIRIIKDPCRIVEGDTVFREIFCRFTRIPFEGHTRIMRVTRSYVKCEGFCRKFSSAVIDGMISFRGRWWQERGGDDAGELQGSPFPTGDHSHGRALVCGLPLELSACGRTHGRARGVRRPRDHSALGREVQCSVGKGVSSPQASDRAQLADG